MPPVMQNVYSSNVAKVGHDANTQELVVEWHGGKVSVYSGVSAQVAEDVRNSWSIGKIIREQIIPHYQHKYQEGET